MPNPTIVPITQPRVPFLNPATGYVSREWYMFLLSLNQLTSGSSVSLGDLQKGSPALTVDEVIAIVDRAAGSITPSQDGLLAQIAELQKQVDGLTASPTVNHYCCDDQLSVAPPLAQLTQSAICSAYSTTNQSAAAAGTAYVMTYDTTEIAVGVSITDSSKITVGRTSVYALQFAAQFLKSSGGSALVSVWTRVNGTDVPASAGNVRVSGNGEEVLIAWNYVLSLTDGDYVEFVWATSSTSVSMISKTAAGVVPAIPSFAVTVTEVAQLIN